MNEITLTSKKGIPKVMVFRKISILVIRPSANSVYNCHNAKRIKLLTRPCLSISRLRYHKFKNSFQDSLNLLRTCSLHEE